MDPTGEGEVEFEGFDAWWTAFGSKAANKRTAAGEVDMTAPDVRVERDQVRRRCCARVPFCLLSDAPARRLRGRGATRACLC